MSYLRSACVLLAWVAGIALLYVGAMRLRSVDPFADYRKIFNSEQGMYGIRMSSVQVASYEQGRTVCEFRVREIDVPRGEREIWLRHCDRGRIFDKGKPVAQFETELVHWNSSLHMAQAIGATHIVARDLDVRTTAPAGQPSMTWMERPGTLTIPNPIRGTLGKGTVTAASATASLSGGRVDVVLITWAGTMSYQAKGEKKSRLVQWRAQKAWKTAKPNVATYINGEFVDPENVLVRADKIVHNLDTKLADCDGHCALHSSRMDLTGDAAVVDLNVKKATMTKNVKASVLPKPEDVIESRRPLKPGEKAEDEPLYSKRIGKAYPVTITCDKIVYHYADEEKVSELTGNLKARQDLPKNQWREVTADKATMDEKAETLQLDGNVHLIGSNGDDMEADSAVISTKEGDDSWSVVHPRGSMHDTKEMQEQMPTGDQTKPKDTGKKGTDKGTTGGK